MSSLVDLDNIIKQTKDMKEKEVDVKEKASDSEKISPPKRSFWQRLFGKEKNNFASKPRSAVDSEEQLRNIIGLRKQLGMDDLPLPTKPLIKQELTSQADNRSNLTSDEELSVSLDETHPEPINIPSKEKLQNLRFKLGLDKEVANSRHFYDKLDEQANTDLEEQSNQYEKEQSEIPEGLDHEEELLTTNYHKPLEIEDKELSEKEIEFKPGVSDVESENKKRYDGALDSLKKEDFSKKPENEFSQEPVNELSDDFSVDKEADSIDDKNVEESLYSVDKANVEDKIINNSSSKDSVDDFLKDPETEDGKKIFGGIQNKSEQESNTNISLDENSESESESESGDFYEPLVVEEPDKKDSVNDYLSDDEGEDVETSLKSETETLDENPDSLKKEDLDELEKEDKDFESKNYELDNIEEPPIGDDAKNEKVEDTIKDTAQEQKKREKTRKSLLPSNPELHKEETDSEWPTKDQNIDKEFPEESAHILEEENFVISETPETNIIEKVKETSKTSKDEKLEEVHSENTLEKTKEPKEPEKKQSLADSLNEQIKKTSNLLEEIEQGNIPTEDIIHHLEGEVAKCKSLTEEKKLLDAKYKYNELCKVFEKTELEDDQRTKWFGVLKKTYDKIVEAESF